ncbi:MAG TPA: alpha/beta hydrolase [Magnetospirillaceae bacterium]|jgi:haloacetate dehalogenase
MFEGFRRGKATIDGIEINYVIGGKGPPVLLLHGYPQNLAMWAMVAPVLAQHYTVVCSDLRGYGDSSKPRCLPDRSNYSFRAMAHDQLGLMRSLGFETFQLVGHDRGGRTAHRLTLDHPEAVQNLTVMDIVPTYKLFMETNRHLAGAYWHWYYLSQPEPFPETMIGANPDFFYEASLAGWGAARLADFDPEQLAEYRRCWRNPEMIHGSCSDYRAAASIDLEHDAADLNVKVQCPVLVLWGLDGVMAKFYGDVAAPWRERCVNVRGQAAHGGHFFIDTASDETTKILLSFLTT